MKYDTNPTRLGTKKPRKLHELPFTFINEEREKRLADAIKKLRKDDNAYALRALEFGKDMAGLLEKKIAAEGLAALTKANVDAAGNEADYDGITGNMFGGGMAMACDCWIHGAQLRAIHNGSYTNGEDATKAGHTINPARFTIG
jgi:hypothetical protein